MIAGKMIREEAIGRAKPVFLSDPNSHFFSYHFTRNHSTLLLPLLRISVVFFSFAAEAGEVFFHDGARAMAMVDSVTSGGKLRLLGASGEAREAAVEEIVTIRFWGRRPRSILAGTQEVLLVGGDRFRGRVVKCEKDILTLDSHAVGPVELPMSEIHGLLALPVQGAAGRRAEELMMEPETTPLLAQLDRLLDRRSAAYEGVIEELSPETVDIDDEQLMRTTSLKLLYLAGTRLAQATKRPRPQLPSEVFMRIETRDGGALDGVLEKIEFGLWRLRPLWDQRRTLPVRVDEIVYVEVLNGRTLYLSQLEPSAVKERTQLAPTQPHRRNRNCKGEVLSLGGNHYSWGLGVHADSELSYAIGGRFKTFAATVGIDDKVGAQGSVVFALLGDAKLLAKTDVLRGGDKAPKELSVPVAGVNTLTLQVSSAGDMDLGDCANWADARLIR